VLTLASAVLAQRDPADLARAAQDVRQAIDDEKAGAWDRALSELTLAAQLGQKETPQFLYHLGRCHSNLGMLLLAKEELERAVEVAEDQRERELAKRAYEELLVARAGIASLTLVAPPDGDVGEASIDGEAVKYGFGLTIPVDPGQHTVHVTFVGRPPLELTVSLGRGENGSLAVPARGAIAGSPLTAVAAGEHGPHKSYKALGWAMVGGGLAMVAGGVVLWVLRDNAVGTLTPVCGVTMHMCPPPDQPTIDHGRLYDDLGVALMVVGGATALVGGGLVRYSGPRGTTGRIDVGPMVSSSVGGLYVRGSLW
jgi:hypothetical protein